MSERDAARRSIAGQAIVVASLASAAAWWFVHAGLRAPDVAPARVVAAAVAVLAYAALCTVAVVKARRAARPAAAEGAVLVAFATQTGLAEEIATRTASALRAAGHGVDLRPLARVDATTLAATRLAFFAVATYGEGEPPDTARRYARDVLGSDAALGGLRFGLLALGDRSYEHFCGFGRRVESWLVAHGAEAAFATVDVDRGAAAALATWRERLRPWTGAAAPDDRDDPDDPLDTSVDPLAARFERWRLVERRQVNEGSVGAPLFHLSFEAAGATVIDWRAGDIAVVRVDGRQRDYSIASLPADHRIELLVRCAPRPDGRVGLGAAWLTSTLALGETAALRIRVNRGFRLEALSPSTPLILIGNGTGIAGLRAHLKQRAQDGASRNWLFFGERQSAFDRPYGGELDAWLRSGTLERASFAFSRDDDRRTYVQHRLAEAGEAVARWIADGAVVLVCGSAAGMAEAVDRVLRDLVGDAAVDDMAADGRYRRDVY